MAKFLIASLLCACLLLEGINKVQAGVATVGGSCKTDTCDATTVCQSEICKLKVGGDCSNAKTACLANAECTGAQGSETCTCKKGFEASDDKTKCGAMGIASSMLLVIATFVTSRFF